MAAGCALRTVECMKRKLLFTGLGLALLVLAVGGWIVEGLRFAPRSLIAAAAR